MPPFWNGLQTLTVEPKSLKVSLERGPNYINILPLLLNPGDSIQFKVLVSGMEKQIQPEYRIVGLKEMAEIDEEMSKEAEHNRSKGFAFLTSLAIPPITVILLVLFQNNVLNVMVTMISLLVVAMVFFEFSRKRKTKRY